MAYSLNNFTDPNSYQIGPFAALPDWFNALCFVPEDIVCACNEQLSSEESGKTKTYNEECVTKSSKEIETSNEYDGDRDRTSIENAHTKNVENAPISLTSSDEFTDGGSDDHVIFVKVVKNHDSLKGTKKKIKKRTMTRRTKRVVKELQFDKVASYWGEMTSPYFSGSSNTRTSPYFSGSTNQHERKKPNFFFKTEFSGQ